MKLKTRLAITFLTIILLPLVLMAVAFLGIGIYLTKSSEVESGIKNAEYTMLAEQFQNIGKLTEQLFEEQQIIADTEPEKLEDRDYLAAINDSLSDKASYIIVRKDKEVYYAGNELATAKIFSKLPEFGLENTITETGYYYSDLQKYVRQVDFDFADGSQGSLFIVTKVNALISKALLIDMFVAIAFILVFTSVMLTGWIQRGIFVPIKELNSAMKSISQGNLEYSLSTDTKGEIGDLYTNYEQMRLRLKESAEEKMHTENQNCELVSNISHDLKTPITAIKGYVEGIIDGVADTPEKMDKYIKTIYNKAMDMDRLINELTIYSGIDNNRIPYNFHRLNISEYFGDCIEEVGLDLESKNIKLNYSNFVPEDARIITDPEQMKRVINNIIGNSIKYIDKEKGVIDIRILDEPDSVRIEIEDNGKGIAAKDLGNIFERFYRTDSSRNSAQGGSGIGLSIVKKIIEDHGGYIWATSKEGEGTCMHFVLRKYQEVEDNE